MSFRSIVRVSIHSLCFAAPLVFAHVSAHAEPSASNRRAKGSTAASANKSGKEVTLEGEMMCAKCSLHETEQCQSVLVVKEDKYYFADNAVARENVEKVCGGAAKHAIVTGVVSESKGQKQIAPSSVKLP